MTTRLRKQKERGHRIRTVEIDAKAHPMSGMRFVTRKEFYRYGKWYTQEQLDSLAAYKYVTYDNQEGLLHYKEYDQYDITRFIPTFKIKANNRNIISPIGFFTYLMEEEYQLNPEEWKQLFRYSLPDRTSIYEQSYDYMIIQMKCSIFCKWDSDPLKLVLDHPLVKSAADGDKDLLTEIQRFITNHFVEPDLI